MAVSSCGTFRFPLRPFRFPLCQALGGVRDQARLSMPTWPHHPGRIALAASPWPHDPGRIALAVTPWPHRPGCIALAVLPLLYRSGCIALARYTC